MSLSTLISTLIVMGSTPTRTFRWNQKKKQKQKTNKQTNKQKTTSGAYTRCPNFHGSSDYL